MTLPPAIPVGQYFRQNVIADFKVAPNHWLRFVYLYAGAVADAPLVYSANSILPEQLQELRLDRLSGRPGEYVRTRARLNDGREYFSMHLIPLRGDMPEPIFSYLRRRYPDAKP